MTYSSQIRIFSLLTLAVFLAIGVACSHFSNRNALPGRETVLWLRPGPGNPRNSEGDFIQLRDGRLLFVYTHFTNGSNDDARAYLAGRFSSDGGRTWSQEDTLILPNEAGQNVMSVSLLRLQNGTIALFYLRKNAPTDCLPLVRFSTDGARTWSAPTVCVARPGYYVMNNDRAVQLKGGRILLPLALHNVPGGDHFFNGRLQCAISDDQGRTWHMGAEVPNPSQVTSQEPGLVPLRDGRILLFCRTDRGTQFVSFSNDSGETWSPLRPGTIRSPLSPASIERIPATGDWLLVWNDTYIPGALNGGPRTPLNLAISKDEGKTWQLKKTLETDPKGWYCYTAISFEDDHVLLAYCAGDRRKEPGLATTKITRLSLDWVYARATPPPFVQNDVRGQVALSDSLKNARIFYSFDANVPLNRYRRYSKPFRVTRLMPVFARAVASDRTPSRLVSFFVGRDLLEKTRVHTAPPLPGLAVRYVQGEFFSTIQIDTARTVGQAVLPKVEIGPAPGDKNFGMCLSGFVRVPQTGPVTFFLASNDGSTLSLNNHRFIDNDRPHGFREVSAPANLEAGWYKISIRYFQLGGSKGLRLRWKFPNKEVEEIPPPFFRHTKNEERFVK